MPDIPEEILPHALMEMIGEPFCPIPKSNDVFTIEAKIGSGSYSDVYQAREKLTNRKVALKSYRIRLSDPSLYQRAATEMSFLKFLVHPNIIRYAFCDIQRTYMYLGLELSPYGSLRKYMKPGEPMPERKVQSIMKQLLSALAYIHNLQILHGDVKPENIIVTNITPEYTIKLTDFGLAEVLGDGYMRNSRGGSFFYMAPELHLKFPCDISTDLFSAGVVMYELLFSKMPLPVKVSKENYISNLRKKVPVRYNVTILEMLSADCINLVKGLLCYDKHMRPIGEALIKDPFLQIEDINFNKQNQYLNGCDCLIKSVEFVNKKTYGKAYVEVMQAILHLKIYLNTIGSDDGLQDYMIAKIREYINFSEQIRAILQTDNMYNGYLSMQTETERLRCLLASTPSMIDAYDLCLVGEMYIHQNKIEIGSHRLYEGLDFLLKEMPKEPISDRRKLLQKKVRQWVLLLERVENYKNKNFPGTSTQKD